MEKHVFIVSDMNCNGCVATIQKGLEVDARIESIDIQLSKKQVSVSGDITSDETAEILRNSGFKPEESVQKKGFLGSLFSS
ncbi:MAG: heavy-metal-associated domain-containing protein [Candidatus Marinimicrobia bacterium]|jgi:copper chaperone CopZ|nr:heavy-metal-associated domain-containing protein [Candidatus Neomarinimicrobiota bacterium]MBT4362658.1 heavy-metal-associated domain-containing protein [Candidatus Neomarinimicrobiota bacterium]MBT4716120.1 heavy-metal-associated domain-containing protein [Candidatus Neomarinimicrobiota bacterium]MBT4947184.1 heavy-metal-associated domain-containing protein [Candidatus Neomarinimicrobiota bacterium]MBT5268546.1 heavy-metal-associated domain-containing protein [Candidatus Neomarinimicrobiota